jgi:hypothetical protein
VRRSLQARLRQELGNLPPTKRLGEDIGQLTIGGNPLKAKLLKEKKLVDDMELAVYMPVFLLGAAITTDMHCRLVVAEKKRWINRKKIG